MLRQSYDTDVTDSQWNLIEQYLPAAKTGGRKRTTNIREVLNGIFYLGLAEKVRKQARENN
jgi:putative transposase